ncbi:hypothetical protein R1sor_010934 [Riccia sorocarpa]|uniref:Uncharacterized protein n=1 Tax=Riccia sorocarpa TaxID=122646 RepID=A0ABD3HZH2_9MARC
MDIAMRLAAKYGPISALHKNARARVESRREKNVMVTNPSGHQGFSWFRARFESSSAEVGAADGAVGAGGTAVGADGDYAKFDQSSGEEEDDHGQAPHQKPVEEDGGDDEDDHTSAQRTIVPQPLIQRAIHLDPQPSVLEAIPLDPQPLVARTVTPQTGTPQPSTMRTVVSDLSCARIIVPEPSSRHTRAQTQSASARGTEERRVKKNKKNKKKLHSSCHSF